MQRTPPLVAILPAALTFLLASALLAQPVKVFDRMGKVARLDTQERVVVIEDQLYQLSASTVSVYTYDPTITDPQAMRSAERRQSLSAIRQNMQVGFNVEKRGQMEQIVEFWILTPESLKALKDSEKREQ
jgi:hypothetical protein